MNVLISVGEYSGDLLASDLLKFLPKSWNFQGMAGPSLRKTQRVQTVIPMESVSCMGLAFFKHLFSIDSALSTLSQLPVDLAILVDFPGFHMRLGKLLKLRGVKVVQYVAPKLWAWGEWRTHSLQKACHKVLGILPFEEHFFLEKNIPYTYVGCPLWERIQEEKQKVLSVLKPRKRRPPIQALFLPGSRMEEIQVAFKMWKQLLHELSPSLWSWTVPKAPNLTESQWKSSIPQSLLHHPQITWLDGQAISSMLTSDVALVTSGTATLECAFAHLPMVVFYKVSPLLYFLAKPLLKKNYVSLPNFWAQKSLIPEFIQNFPIQTMAKTLTLLADPSHPSRQEQQKAFASWEGEIHGSSSYKAAKAIEDMFL